MGASAARDRGDTADEAAAPNPGLSQTSPLLTSVCIFGVPAENQGNGGDSICCFGMHDVLPARLLPAPKDITGGKSLTGAVLGKDADFGVWVKQSSVPAPRTSLSPCAKQSCSGALDLLEFFLLSPRPAKIPAHSFVGWQASVLSFHLPPCIFTLQK